MCRPCLKKPKNISLSEDNGHWMPQGSRFEFKVCPRTVLCQQTGDTGGAVSGPGLSGRQGTSPGRGSGMRMRKASLRVTFIFWPSDGRPILACVYLCPTETYKAAQHASIDHVQSGRKHSPGLMSTCQTWIDTIPPRENQHKKKTDREETHPHLLTPREILNSIQRSSCPTSMLTRKHMSTSHMHGTGTGMAPSQTEALRNWLTKHEPAIEPESVEAARQLAQDWEEFPVPQPTRRTRSLPPRELESMVHTQPTNSTPPRERQKSNSQPEPLTRRRLRGKTSLTTSPPSPNSFCPAEPVDDTDSQDSEGRSEPYGCWDEIYDVLRKPVLVDRNIPRELKTIWQRVVIQLLANDQSRTDLYPIASDLVFILPKLVLSHPPGKEKGKARIHRIQECLRRASQGEWPHLIERALQMETPNQEPDASQPLASGPDTLPPRIAKRLYKAASQGQLDKAWRQLHAPPPVHVGQE